MCQTGAKAICELKNMPLSGDKELDAQIKKWIKWDRNQDTLAQIMDAVKKEEWDTLRDRLCNRVSFGTAGLRSVMRAGFDSINDLVVLQTAQGVCAYLKEQYPDEATWTDQGVVVGYDGRYNSQRFADITAIVFLNNNFRVNLFKQFVATPFIPYAVQRLKCLAGIMVTASHNPKQDNGVKVYWTNGAQVCSPRDEEIQESIMNNLHPRDDSWDETALCANELLFDPYNNVVLPYFDALKKDISCPLMESNGKCTLTFTYTAMHGVGYQFAQSAFKKINLKSIIPVVEQIKPDPEFPTTPKPNPEEGKTALCLSIKTATENNSDIILANDPDADRLAVAERGEDKTYKIFTGNEMGALLGWWALENYRLSAESPNISNCVMISSTVSSKILKAMADIEGFTFHETLTGFKWMGNKAYEEQNAGKTVLFAFEEAIGYMMGTKLLDKDGISAAAHVATMACYLRCKKCMTMQEKLRDIYEKYGFHTSIVSYFTCRDPEKIKQIFDRLRTFDEGQENTYPTDILGGEFEIANVRDLTTGYDSSTANKAPVLPVTPGTEMITFTFKNNMVITLRASGTEPKMKYYAELACPPDDKRWEEQAKLLQRMVDAAVNEFYEPRKNGLERKTD